MSASGSVLRLLPSDDAYVNGGVGEKTNFGAEDKLLVKSDDAGEEYNRATFLRFYLDKVKGGVRSARLNLYCYALPNGGPATCGVFAVPDAGWTETALNWKNAPPAGTLLAQIRIDKMKTRYSIDLSDYVKSALAGGRILDLRLADVGNGAKLIGFRSKENLKEPETQPYLEITY